MAEVSYIIETYEKWKLMGTVGTEKIYTFVFVLLFES